MEKFTQFFWSLDKSRFGRRVSPNVIIVIWHNCARLDLSVDNLGYGNKLVTAIIKRKDSKHSNVFINFRYAANFIQIFWNVLRLHKLLERNDSDLSACAN